MYFSTPSNKPTLAQSFQFSRSLKALLTESTFSSTHMIGERFGFDHRDWRGECDLGLGGGGHGKWVSIPELEADGNMQAGSRQARG